MLSDLLPANLFAFFLVFARMGGAIMVLPGFGEAFVFARGRLLLALAVSLVVLPVVEPGLPPLPGSPLMLFLLLGGEIAIGLFMGLIARITLLSLQTAGMIIAYQSSMANALIPDPIAGQQGAVAGSFLMTLAIVLIFVTNLHHVMLAALVDSYALFPAGALPVVGDISDTAARLVADSFRLAIQIAAPFLVIGLIFQIGVGLLARLMPQVQIFFVAMPVQIALGLLILMLTVSAGMMWFLDRFEGAVTRFAG